MIRTAQPSDAPAILAIVNEIIANTTITFDPTPKKLDDIVAWTEAVGRCFVRESAGTVVGYARYFPFRAGIGYQHTAEYSIALLSEMRGRGYARDLLLAVCRAAPKQGITNLIAGISGSNLQGIRFHEKLGFDQVGVLPGVGRKFERDLDLVLMQKRL